MKRVTGIVWMMMLVTLLFCACGHEESVSRAAEEPTMAPLQTVTEPLYGDDHHTLEQTLDSSGNLIQECSRQYDGLGNLIFSSVTEFDAGGEVTLYREAFYTGGVLASSLVKHYEAGILFQQVEVSYFENGAPERIDKQVFSDVGTLLERRSRSYGADGTLLSEETEHLDTNTNLRMIRVESHYENGNPKQLHEGIHHPVSGALLNGKIEDFDENGTLARLEEATWDGENRTVSLKIAQYDAAGTVISARQEMRYYDGYGNEAACEITAYEQEFSFAFHCTENRTFDRVGQVIGREIRYYLEDGSPAEQYAYRYEYENGLLTKVQLIHDLTPGTRQNKTVTEYAYDSQGNLIREVQTGFDKDDLQKFQTVKEFDAYGKVTTFVTVSNLGNCYTYTYTYDEEGRTVTELLTTEYRSGRRIDYRETAWEYHENGKPKRITVHTWTSYDEAKYPDAPISDLGKTTVTEYDEEGNKL